MKAPKRSSRTLRVKLNESLIGKCLQTRALHDMIKANRKQLQDNENFFQRIVMQNNRLDELMRISKEPNAEKSSYLPISRSEDDAISVSSNTEMYYEYLNTTVDEDNIFMAGYNYLLVEHDIELFDISKISYPDPIGNFDEHLCHSYFAANRT